MVIQDRQDHHTPQHKLPQEHIFNVNAFIGNTLQGVSIVEFIKFGDTNVYKGTASISTSATAVSLTGNYDGSVVNGVTLSSDVNSRQGDVTKPVVQVSGSGLIEGPEGNRIANIEIKPEMSRIEITPNFTAFTPETKPVNIKNVNIAAIFINNTKVTRGGNIDRTAPEDFKTVYSAEGMKYKLYDYMANTKSTYEYPEVDYNRSSPPVVPPIVRGWNVIDDHGNALVNAFNNDAIGYNIFPQAGANSVSAAKALHPHIIVLIRYYNRTDESSNWEEKSGYVNITAFKTVSGNMYVNKFEQGNVYSFSLGDLVGLITDPTTLITTTPDPETGGVEINCSVASWNIIPVIPEV